MNKRIWLPALLSAALLASCKSAPPAPTPEPPAAVDQSAANAEGRVRVRCTGELTPPIKVQVKKEGESPYNYDLPADGTEIVLPLTRGDGPYTVTVLEHAKEDLYRPMVTQELTLALTDPNAPFLYPSRMVDYGGDIEALAAELTAGEETVPGQVDILLHYVTDSLTYDKEKVETVEPGYLPSPARTVEEGEGICYDYAALLTALLRSRGIPCRLEVGWSGSLYHAWVSVYAEDGGELSGGITLKEGWTLLDPTFLDTQEYSDAMLDYMAREEKYQVVYTY